MAQTTDGLNTQKNTSVVQASGTQWIDDLLPENGSAVKWGGSTGTGVSLTFSFPWTTLTRAYFGDSSGEPDTGRALDVLARQATLNALQQWTAVANLSFTQVSESSSSVGDLRFAWTSLPTLLQAGSAWASFPSNYYEAGGNVWLAWGSDAFNTERDWNGQRWVSASFEFSVLIHEIGHALGLEHPFEGALRLDAAHDTSQYSVMSYTDQTELWWRRVDGDSFAYTHIAPETPMLYDVAAIQYVYGANLQYRTGSDVYSFDPAVPILRTLWDAGGNDTISVANFSRGCVINLNEGAYSSIRIPSPDVPPGWGDSPLVEGHIYQGNNNLAIAFGCKIENATGGSGEDTLVGNALGNWLMGNAGNDTLDGRIGNDVLDGGAGVDTALYAGKRSGYALSKAGSGYLALDKIGAEGADSLSNIEKLQFADCSVDLSIGSKSQTIGATDLKSLEELYVAFFNRVPDASGLAYWIDDFNSGTSFNTIADNFYSIALQFGSVTGYAANSTNADFIKTIYKNVLGRSGATAPPQVDVDYWNANLLSGQFTKGTLIKTMLTAAHEYKHDATWSWMADLLDNKIAVANLFAVQQGLGYNTPEESITKGMAIAAAVTPTDISVAIQLIGVSDGFSLV